MELCVGGFQIIVLVLFRSDTLSSKSFLRCVRGREVCPLCKDFAGHAVASIAGRMALRNVELPISLAPASPFERCELLCRR